MKRIWAWLLAAALFVALGAAAAAEKPASWEIIEKIVVLYGANGEEAADRIVELLGELEAVDARLRKNGRRSCGAGPTRS